MCSEVPAPFVMRTSNSSVSFLWPDSIPIRDSSQLIWDTDLIQCVSSPHSNLISRFSCNRGTNVVSISSDNIVTVSNLNKNVDEIKLTVVEVSTSTCGEECYVRSAVGVFVIVNIRGNERVILNNVQDEVFLFCSRE